jgi:hypothetical protein
MGRLAAGVLAAGLATLAGPAAAQGGLRLSGELPSVQHCPAGLPTGTECRRGRDYLGAWVWMARPAQWNRRLVVFTHGDPFLEEPTADRSAQDLQRWRFWLEAGYAWVGSGYRQAGLELRAAADDSERARQSFIGEHGEPDFTLLHGQGWGAGVAASVAGRYTAPDLHPRRPSSGRPPYSAVLLSSGLLGGVRGEDVHLDLRLVYQAVCHNHPATGEPDYPLWMGLPPPGSGHPGLTRAQLNERLEACTGLSKTAAARSPAQRQALERITRLTGLPPAGLPQHLAWATWQFQDIVWRKLKGRNPFGNEGVVYGGADVDRDLDAAVPRYRADPAAYGALAADLDPSPRLHRPVLTLHAVNDPVALVELESYWKQQMVEAGSDGNLLQLYLDDDRHDDLGSASYLAAAAALEEWVRSGTRPTPTEVARRCAPQRGAPPACRWLPDYEPRLLDDRVPPRRRNQVPLPAAAEPAVTRPNPLPSTSGPDASNREPRLPPAPEPISPLTMPPTLPPPGTPLR